ncbi:DUF4397 domain-containing protein [Pedobacter sp. SD-b]|uniref:DUF4397 domain-containing protein n=1 Tax=Pedobacter segetis TaxID=2793069 RepID=A0ABS1BMY0_9SPHI|nr:DUF4397 domain-containing protein [Pedobacter segetis]MBK0384173.1 DUF4397 domain-containing protein [Pedobacter segetis]
MKNSIKISKKKYLIHGLAAIALMFSLSSCLKNNNDNATPNIAALSVIHAAPGLQSFDFVINNQRVNSAPFNFSERLPYFNIYGGNRTFGIFKAGSADSIKTGNFLAESGKFYSIYVIGQATEPQFLILKDSLTVPTVGKARVRFLNLSPDAPALSLSLKSTSNPSDSTLFSNQTYKSQSLFTEIDGGKTYSFTTRSNSETAVATLDNVNIESGKIYTIWSKGLISSTNDTTKVGLKVQQNY